MLTAYLPFYVVLTGAFSTSKGKFHFVYLLRVCLRRHDPTSKNRQGADVGEQYRSIILYTDESDRKEMDLYIDKIRPSFSKPILTEVKKLDEFYEAEDYHKNYYENNRFQPYCMLVISPKLSKIRKEFGIKSQD